MAIGAAAIAPSMAQVYSANAVGYVNLSLPAGFSLIANPLNGTNNSLNTILPLADNADGTTIYRFKPSIQRYAESLTWVAGFGWVSADPDPALLVLPPGEGIFIKPSGPTPLTVTFVGEVPQGALSNPVLGGNKYAIASSQVPQALPIGDSTPANAATTLQFPAAEGDTIYVFNSTTQRYKESYTYVAGFGWISANVDDPGPLGPTIPVATSFFLFRAGGSVNWTRNFSVN